MASRRRDTGFIEEGRRFHLGKWKCSWCLPRDYPEPPERFAKAQRDSGRVESTFNDLFSPQGPFSGFRQVLRAQAEELDLHDFKLHTCSKLFRVPSCFGTVR